jgi:endonuclease-3 related protein
MSFLIGSDNVQLTVYDLYQKMRKEVGPSGWWPADSKEEIIIDAILIQNTNWQNADKARQLFADKTAFVPTKICQLDTASLETLVRPAGFYRNKSKAIRDVFSWLAEHDFDYLAIRRQYGDDLRNKLLALHGIGQETADVLLTYVFDVPRFISDKYARTLFTLLGIDGLAKYQDLDQRYQLDDRFTPAMAKDFHGLIDEFGKVYFHPRSKFANSFLAGDRLILH